MNRAEEVFDIKIRNGLISQLYIQTSGESYEQHMVWSKVNCGITPRIKDIEQSINPFKIELEEKLGVI